MNTCYGTRRALPGLPDNHVAVQVIGPHGGALISTIVHGDETPYDEIASRLDRWFCEPDSWEIVWVETLPPEVEAVRVAHLSRAD